MELEDDELSQTSSLSSESGQEGEIKTTFEGINRGVEEDQVETDSSESSDDEKNKSPPIYIQKKTYELPKNFVVKKQTKIKNIQYFPRLDEGLEINGIFKIGNFTFETDKYQLYSLFENEKYSIKLNYSSENLKEVEILKKLKKEEISFVPKLKDKFSGKDKSKNISQYIAFKWDGKTLLDFSKEGKEIGEETILSVLDNLETLHDYNILFVDFDPINFSYPSEKGNVKFVNFSNAQYISEPRKNRKSVGNSVFSSISFQEGGIASIKTDLESFIYMFVSLFNKGKLPWSKYTDKEYKQMLNEKRIKNLIKAGHVKKSLALTKRFVAK